MLKKFSTYGPANNGKGQRRQYADGEDLLFQGESFRLRVIEHDRRHTEVSLRGECFIVHIDRNLPVKERPDEIRAKLETYYREMAREAVDERARYFSAQLGLNYNNIRIKEQKTRWGSCSGLGNLNFNWKIVMAPPDIIDYIVVHELCHLVHMNHSKDFWSLVECQIPDYKLRKKWLRENGFRLRLALE